VPRNDDPERERDRQQQHGDAERDGAVAVFVGV